MKESPKFKVGDRVRITTDLLHDNFSGKPKGYEFVVGEIYCPNDDIRYREEVGIPGGVNQNKLELVPTKDYKDTYVRVNSEEERNKAISFYENKGFKKCGGVIQRYFDKDYYIRCYTDGIGMGKHTKRDIGGISFDFSSYRDITEEVLGKKEEKIIEKCKQEYADASDTREEKPRKVSHLHGCLGGLQGTSPSRIVIDDPVYTRDRDFKLDRLNTNIISQPFNNLPTTKMSTLRNNIRDRFFKKEESKLADLIEEVEEGFEPVIDLYNRLDEITDKQEDLVKDLDYAVEKKNKSDIKEAKKKLEEFKKETLEDKLFEQLITISKKLIK